MAKIICPNKDYTGVSASVAFAAGVGYTNNPSLIKWFESHGYKVEKEPEKSKEPEPFEGMTDEQIRDFALQNNVNLGNTTARKSIIKKIVEAGVKVPEADKEDDEGTEGGTDDEDS